jgi:hypothetical protein
MTTPGQARQQAIDALTQVFIEQLGKTDDEARPVATSLVDDALASKGGSPS